MVKLSNKYLIGLNYKSKSAKQLADDTGLSKKHVHEIARKLGVTKTPNWTIAEINFLIIMKPKVSSFYLKRSLASCKTKYSRWKNTKLINK